MGAQRRSQARDRGLSQDTGLDGYRSGSPSQADQDEQWHHRRIRPHRAAGQGSPLRPPTEANSSAQGRSPVMQHPQEKLPGHLSDPSVAGPQTVEQRKNLAQLRPVLNRLGRRGMQRLDHLASHLAASVGPHRGWLVARGANRAGHRLRRPGRGHARHESTQLSGGDEAQRVKRDSSK